MRARILRRRRSINRDCKSEEAHAPNLANNIAKRSQQFLTDLQESVPQVNKVNARKLLLMFLLFLCFLALFALMFSLLPPFEEFERFGYLGVLLANFLSSMSVIIPTPPGVALTIAVAAVASPIWAALSASLGGTLGEFTAYIVGYGGQRFLNLKQFQRYKVAERWMQRYGGFAIFFFALFPFFMFDLVGIAAGALKYPFGKFLFYCYLGRVPRAFIEAFVGASLFELILPYLPQWISAPFLS